MIHFILYLNLQHHACKTIHLFHKFVLCILFSVLDYSLISTCTNCVEYVLTARYNILLRNQVQGRPMPHPPAHLLQKDDTYQQYHSRPRNRAVTKVRKPTCVKESKMDVNCFSKGHIETDCYYFPHVIIWVLLVTHLPQNSQVVSSSQLDVSKV